MCYYSESERVVEMFEVVLAVTAVAAAKKIIIQFQLKLNFVRRFLLCCVLTVAFQTLGSCLCTYNHTESVLLPPPNVLYTTVRERESCLLCLSPALLLFLRRRSYCQIDNTNIHTHQPPLPLSFFLFSPPSFYAG